MHPPSSVDSLARPRESLRSVSSWPGPDVAPEALARFARVPRPAVQHLQQLALHLRVLLVHGAAEALGRLVHHDRQRGHRHRVLAVRAAHHEVVRLVAVGPVAAASAAAAAAPAAPTAAARAPGAQARGARLV